MVFLATVLPWSNSVSPSVFIGQVLTSGSFVFSPRGVVRQGLNRVLTPGEARLPQRHSSLSLEFPSPSIDPPPGSIIASIRFRFRSRQRKRSNSIESLFFSLPLLLQGFTRVRLARIMQSLEEREMEERDRERKKRDYAAVPRTRY